MAEPWLDQALMDSASGVFRAKTMSDFQQYTWYQYLINNVEDIVIFYV